jgi:hypothetical protein
MLREMRLWTTQVITPAAVAILAIPELRDGINERIKEMRRRHEGKKLNKEINVTSNEES